MSEHDLPELSADANAAWRAFARSIAPDDGAEARVLQRVRTRTKAAADDEDDASPSQHARRAAAAVLVVKSSAISVGIAGTALLSIKLIVAAVTPAAAPVVPTTNPPAVEAPQPVASRSDRSARPVAAPIAAPVLAEPSPPTALVPAKPRRVASASAPDLLQAEIDLGERMRAAVQAKEYSRALELVEQHRREFPRGALAEERLAFAVIIACKLGRADARDEARNFIDAHPHSLQLASVRAACDAAAVPPMDPAGFQQ